MRTSTKSFFGFLILLALVVAPAFARPTWPALAQSPTTQPQAESLVGRWRVKFRFAGDVERNLIFEAKAKNVGSFSLLDSGPDNKPVPELAPAVWSKLTNDRLSFSGEAEMPLGTCCREIGTLIFKGKFETNNSASGNSTSGNSISGSSTSGNSISGGLIFVTSVDEEESPYKYHSQVGTFTAVRVN